jgi:hypothetical protein
LYSSTSTNADLKCLNRSGESVACPNGVCRLCLFNSGYQIDSTCSQRKLDRWSYALDLDQSQSPYAAMAFNCNTPLCNSKETTQQVAKILASANITSDLIMNVDKIIN